MVRCDCGFEARAADQERLVAEVRRHASEAHGMALTHDEALLVVSEQAGPATTSRDITPPTGEEQR